MGVLRLEDAIRRMTSLPAQTFRLRDRGLVREGMAADLVVFDPATIGDRATYTDPHQFPAGIRWVIVNGQIALEDGRPMGGFYGRVLRWRAEHRPLNVRETFGNQWSTPMIGAPRPSNLQGRD
jgi:N-acyl-D-amino-acid deacylase